MSTKNASKSKKSNKKSRTINVSSLNTAQRAILAKRAVNKDQEDAVLSKIAAKEDSTVADLILRASDTYEEDRATVMLQDKRIAREVARRDLRADQMFNLDCDLEYAALLSELKRTDPKKYVELQSAGTIPKDEDNPAPTAVYDATKKSGKKSKDSAAVH